MRRALFCAFEIDFGLSPKFTLVLGRRVPCEDKKAPTQNGSGLVNESSRLQATASGTQCFCLSRYWLETTLKDTGFSMAL